MKFTLPEKIFIPSNVEHPFLFFRKRDRSEILGQMKYTGFLDYWRGLVKKFIDEKFVEDLYLIRERWLPFLPSLSAIYFFTREKHLFEKIVDVVYSMLEIDSWVMPYHMPLKVDLNSAHISYVIAFIYDCIYEDLSSSDRKIIEKVLVNRVVEPFITIHRDRLEWWTKVYHNWRSVICSEVGLTGLALAGKYSGVEDCIREALKGDIEVLDRIGRDGGYSEGVGYWNYGIGEIVKFADALKKITDGYIDLYKHPRLKATGYFGLYMATPDGGCFNFSDCSNVPPSPWFMAKLASEYRNPYLQWYAVKHMEESRGDIFYTLFLDPKLIPKTPVDLPLGRLFRDINVFVARSSWNDDEAIYIGLKCGDTTANHSHLDINSIVIYGYGRRIIKDLGRWPYAHGRGYFDLKSGRWDYDSNSSIGHNTILVDGRGQTYCEKCRGKIIKSYIGREYSYAFGEGHEAYPNLLNKFTRLIALINPNLVVLADLVSCKFPMKIEWLFHFEGGVSINGNEINLINKDVLSKIFLIKPALEEDVTLSICRRKSYIKATHTEGFQSNDYISISPLHRLEKCIFICLFQVTRVGEIWNLNPILANISDKTFTLDFTMKYRRRLEVDFIKPSLKLIRLEHNKLM